MDANDYKLDNVTGPDSATLLLEIDRLKAVLLEQEKRAVIGQLTAGIIHEIKNPLNFMINFSKISLTLVTDLKEITDNAAEGELSEDDSADLNDIISDLSANLNRITENGNRAIRIIMGMLAQARDNNTERFEPTDVNQLVDDFTKLAYQGIRGENKDFNMSIKTEYDANLGKINIDGHDLGRAILNIVNNACYAMEQKMKQGLDGSYQPQIVVSTSRSNDDLIIKIKDNGTGMPAEIKAKIFKPFFTTKPSGEGTGLGLSMTYDIVTRIHKGRLEVNAEDKLFTEFVITIPTTITTTN